MAEYTLPDLDYDYGALEPHISGQINEIHHGKHHATYVKGLNDAIAKLDEAAPTTTTPRSSSTRRTWRSTSAVTSTTRSGGRTCPPTAATSPTGDLAAAIDDQFGSFDKFRAQFTAAANGLQGSGWAVLGYDTLGSAAHLPALRPAGQRAAGIIPLLQVDMWEHAYYLQYKNVKADYVKAFWNVSSRGRHTLMAR